MAYQGPESETSLPPSAELVPSPNSIIQGVKTGKESCFSFYVREEDNGNTKEKELRIVGISQPLLGVIEEVQSYAATRATVTIEGENGVGKELFARALHALGPWRMKPLVVFDCAEEERPEDTEKRLFGSSRYTGVPAGSGAVHDASGGTLFIDEFQFVSRHLQQKLNRMLAYGDFARLGSPTREKCRARIVFACSKPLEDLNIDSGLYRRLFTHRIRIPPLREHKEDIPYLVNHFVELLCRELSRGPVRMTEGVPLKIHAHLWKDLNAAGVRAVLEDALIRLQNSDVLTEDLIRLPQPKGYSLPKGLNERQALLVQVFESLPVRFGVKEYRALLIERLGTVPSARTLSRDLSELRERGIIQKVGLTKGTLYIFS